MHPSPSFLLTMKVTLMALRAVGLSTHIYNNHIKSALLLCGYPVLILLMVWAFFMTIGYQMNPDKETFSYIVQRSFKETLSHFHWVLLFTAGWFTIAYFFHARMIRAATGSVPVTRKQYPKIYNMLENLCISRGITMPRFEIIDSPSLNAFASGLNKSNYTITLTRGIIDALQDDELEAVIAHELTHILNRDVRLLVIGVIFVGMISFLAEFLFRMLIHGRGSHSRYRSSRSSGDNKGGGIMIVALIILVIGYLFAVLIRFSISRKREYLADAGAVELTQNPEGMMRALMRIDGRDQIKDMPNDIQQMCIENSHNFMGVFATHPSIDDRIQTLSDMTNTPVPTLPVSLRRPPKRPWGEPPSAE